MKRITLSDLFWLLLFVWAILTVVRCALADPEPRKQIKYEQPFRTEAERQEYYALAKYHVGAGRFGKPKFLVTWQDEHGTWWFKRETDGRACKFQWPEDYKGARR